MLTPEVEGLGLLDAKFVNTSPFPTTDATMVPTGTIHIVWMPRKETRAKSSLKARRSGTKDNNLYNVARNVFSETKITSTMTTPLHACATSAPESSLSKRFLNMRLKKIWKLKNMKTMLPSCARRLFVERNATVRRLGPRLEAMMMIAPTRTALRHTGAIANAGPTPRGNQMRVDRNVVKNVIGIWRRATVTWMKTMA